jgi:Ran GTPase-activating protein (RanGAP) involved in mRNA processing and transport
MALQRLLLSPNNCNRDPESMISLRINSISEVYGCGGVEELAKCVEIQDQCKSIHVDAFDFSADEFKVISRAILANPVVEGLSVWINNQYQKEHFEEIIQAIQKSRWLKQFWFSCDTFSVEQGRLFAQTLQFNTALQIVELRNAICEQSAKLICEALISNAETVLREIDFSSGGISPKIGLKEAYWISELLKRKSSLIKLNLNGNCIRGKGARFIAEALKFNSSLQELDLSDNLIGTQCTRWIANSLTINSSLIRLILRSNNIGDDGTRSIVDSLKMNYSLRKIELSFNLLGNETIIYFDKCLECAFSIQYIHFYDAQGVNRIHTKTWEIMEMVLEKCRISRHGLLKTFLCSLFEEMSRKTFPILRFDKAILRYCVYPYLFDFEQNIEFLKKP